MRPHGRDDDLPDVRAPLQQSGLPGAGQSKGYLEMLNVFRVLACAAVVANHSFIWANMSTNVIGTGFITMLHLSRNSFFFLSGLVICYSQISHPRASAPFGNGATSNWVCPISRGPASIWFPLSSPSAWRGTRSGRS